jgi:hypothetical protein
MNRLISRLATSVSMLAEPPRRLLPKHLLKRRYRARALQPSVNLLEGRTMLSATASFLGSDAATQGNWIGTYGSQGYDVIGSGASYPSYAGVAPINEGIAVWTSNTSAPPALETPGNAGRIAACWYASTSFYVNVALTDGQQHSVALYFLDWDKQGRSEQVQISSATTGVVLDTETISSFSGGEYLRWDMSGNILIKVTDMSGPNAVMSGLFFDPPTPIATASFVGSDAATQGNWIGTYGSQGYDVIGSGASYPTYAGVAPVDESLCTWTSSTSAPPALETPGGAGRIAACWYASTSFWVNVALTDGQQHSVALYFLDWDKQGRSEQVQISSATTGVVLDTETISSFSGGEYLRWDMSGNILIKVTDMSGPNAVMSGLFFDSLTPSPTPPPPPNPDAVTTANWSGYVAATNLSRLQANSVTEVSGSWTVPKVTGPSTGSTYSSVWVGIDGFNNSTVEQVGTSEDVINGAPVYQAWWEMFSSGRGQPEQVISRMTVEPGDSITASVQYITSGTHAGHFDLSIIDNSRPNDSFSIYASSSQYQSPLAQRSTAEWIVEAPTVNGSIAQLANFGSVTFTNASAVINGVSGPINDSLWQSLALNIGSGVVVYDTTSVLTKSGTSFVVTYNPSA